MNDSSPSQSSDVQPSTRELTVLFLCTGNTARSQLAEALLRLHASDRFEVTSAGLEPGVLNPYTVRVLEERGIDTEGMHAKDSTAEQNCPIFPGVSKRLAWPFEDPAAFEGDEAATLNKFREVRDAIETRILEFVKTFKK